MTSPLDRLADIHRMLTDDTVKDDHGRLIYVGLNPSALRSKLREYERAGLPSSSYADLGIHPNSARGNGQQGFDSADRRHREAWSLFCKSIGDAQKALGEALRIQNSVLVVADLVPDELETSCANLPCPNVHNRKSGECVRCRVWRHRHDGESWTPAGEEVDA